MTGVFCLFATGSAVGAEAIKLNPSVEQSLRQHPNVAEAKARVCQAIHRLGLDKARARPQVPLSISGGRQLIERVKVPMVGPTIADQHKVGILSFVRVFA